MDENKRGKIIVVGMGPGNPRCVLPVAMESVQKAKILVGGRRLLADYAQEGQKTFPITGNLVETTEFLRREVVGNDVTIMVSGDPGYYSLLDLLRREFPSERIVTIPGISSLQYAFGRLNMPWHDAALVSFHGRDPSDEQISFSPGKTMGMLTDKERNSKTIAARLLRLGWPKDATFCILERLSYPDEKITVSTLADAAASKATGHCILIVAAQ